MHKTTDDAGFIAIPNPFPESDADLMLATLADIGFQERVRSHESPGLSRSDYQPRLAAELDRIRDVGLSSWFLSIADWVNEAKSRAHVFYPFCDSFPSSLLAYCLGISDLDPVLHGLQDEHLTGFRKYPPLMMRTSAGAIDDVFKYMVKKYGLNRAALIRNSNAFILSESQINVHVLSACSFGQTLPTTRLGSLELKRRGYARFLLDETLILTRVAKCVELVEQRTGNRPPLDSIWLDETVPDCSGIEFPGIHCLSMPGAKETFGRFNPQCFRDLVVFSGLVHRRDFAVLERFLKLQKEGACGDISFKGLSPAFSDTFGIPLFQEQLIGALGSWAGFDAKEAETVINSAIEGINEDVARLRTEYLSRIPTSADGPSSFAFICNQAPEVTGRTHCVADAALMAQTAYLKQHFPDDFARVDGLSS